jgi:hypothetical protein
MATAYEKKWPLYLSTKNTILKKYDGRYGYCQPLLRFFFSRSACLYDVFFCFSGSKIFSRRFMKLSGDPNLRLPAYGTFPASIIPLNMVWSLGYFSLSCVSIDLWYLVGMNTALLMTWWHMHLRVKEGMCGLARTMMEMCRVIS